MNSESLPTPSPNVGEHFFMNPTLIQGVSNMQLHGSLQNQLSNEGQSRDIDLRNVGRSDSMQNQVSRGNSSELQYSYDCEPVSIGSDTVSSMNTFSTVLEENSNITSTTTTTTTTNEAFILNSRISNPNNGNDDDDDDGDELYQPDEDDDDEIYRPPNSDGAIDQNPGDFDLSNSVINIDKSEVQFGPKYNIELTPSSKKGGGVSGVDIANIPSKEQKSGSVLTSLESNSMEHSPCPGLHININTPPVQTIGPGHTPLLQTQSAPTWPAPSTNNNNNNNNYYNKDKSNPRLPQQVIHNHHPVAMPLNPGTPPSAALNIVGGNVVLGPHITINNSSSGCIQSEAKLCTEPNIEKILNEAQEKLICNYKHQTKTSFLPWLKGRQIIPMTDFYTESRILAVDKQGKQTRQTVNLVQTLVQEDETRFLVEGEPGMGKTLLAHKLAIDWATKKSLQEFRFVFLIFLRDFKDTLEDYVKDELLSSLSDDKFKKVWEYCKNNEKKVLFILDGYDELENREESKIQKLIESRAFQRSKVVVTARPDVLITIAQKMIVKGFSEAQMFEFIGKYFKLVSEDRFGHNMKRIIEKDYKYRKLAKRPLFCVLLCMLYGSDVVAKLPERLSDLMFKIMLCLIKWNNEKIKNVNENTDSFPPEYKELFNSFGKMALHALKTDKNRFSEKEILEIKGSFDLHLLLNLGFLSSDSENDLLGTKKYWKPVHKIFLEYMAGQYIANHINECRDCRECREFPSIYTHEHVLQFVVGTLKKTAHLALDGKRHPIFLHMKDSEVLMLLREAGPTRDNCRAVAKLLDHNYATVYTSEVDFEGWSSILAQNFRKLKSLEIVWRIKSNNPDQESSFSEASPDLYKAFFTALKSNTSINKIKIRATQDGERFSEEKIALFFSNLELVLHKENLKELEIKELKMPVSSHLRRAIEGATCQTDKKVLRDLENLHLDMFMEDEDLRVLCDRLKECAPNLKELQLTGLVIGHLGFNSLVELLKKSRNLHKLHISMDKAQLQPNNGVFLSKYDNHYTPSDMHTDHKRMIRHAVNESKRAYNERHSGEEMLSSSPDPGYSQTPPGVKGYLKKRYNSSASSGSAEKYNPQSSKDYYSEDELNNPDFDDAEEQTDESKPFCRGNGIPCKRATSDTKTHLQLPKNNANSKHTSPMGTPDNGRKFYTTVKDPTDELKYLFHDTVNNGIKLSYKFNRYCFIPDGENQLPLPLCNNREHKSVFHDLFSALPESSVKSLTLDYPCLYLSTLDLVCLGDAIRKTKHLETLKLQNLKIAKKYIPIVLGLGQSQSLITVILESNGVVITDAAFALACTALRNNTTLKSLSLARWEFNIQDKNLTTRYFQDLLHNWKVTDLNLANCHIDIGVGVAPTLFTPPILLPIHGPVRPWSSIKALRLPHVRVKEPLGLERRGHLLLPVLRNCPNITILDLSASSNQINNLDDNATTKFFQLLGTSFKKLKELTLCNWVFKFKHYEETCAEIGTLVRSCAELKVLVLDKVSEVRSGLSLRMPCRTTFLHQLVNNLPRLSELSLCCYRIDYLELEKDTASHLGSCFHDHWNSTNKFKLKFFGLTSEVENALHESLKKDNFTVIINQGYPLEITVKKRCFLSA